jgi:hypothetical protein
MLSWSNYELSNVQRIFMLLFPQGPSPLENSGKIAIIQIHPYPCTTQTHKYVHTVVIKFGLNENSKNRFKKQQLILCMAWQLA